MNLNDYVKKDISEKKILLDVYPTKKQKKYRSTLNEIFTKYDQIKRSMKKYIDYKYGKMVPKEIENNDIEQLYEEREQLFQLYKIFDKNNRFYEKFELDLLFYKLSNYCKNTIKENDDIIKQIIDTVKQFDIKVSENDFDINIYSKYYMKFFFDDSNTEEGTLSTHVDCYWKCPKVYIYIIVCLKLIILKNERKINFELKKKIDRLLKDRGIDNIQQLNEKYNFIVEKINQLTEDNEEKLILKCHSGEIDINLLSYSKDSLEQSFDYFVIDKFDVTDANITNKYVSSIVELKNNMEEYLLFLNNKNLFEYYDKEYKKIIIEKKDNNSMTLYNNKKSEINKKIKKITSMKLRKNLINIEEEFSEKEKNILFEQGRLIEELYNDYLELDNIYYDLIIKKEIKVSTTADDILYFIINYPYYGYNIIKKVYKIEDEDIIRDKYNELRNMHYNPKKKIINMYLVFMKDDLEQTIINGYRFENINITKDSFNEANTNEIINECNKLILKVKASNFKTPFENIRFIVNVKELKDKNRI